MTDRDSAKIALENLLLHAIVESKDELIRKLRRENDWLKRRNRGLQAKYDQRRGVS